MVNRKRHASKRHVFLIDPCAKSRLLSSGFPISFVLLSFVFILVCDLDTPLPQSLLLHARLFLSFQASHLLVLGKSELWGTIFWKLIQRREK